MRKQRLQREKQWRNKKKKKIKRSRRKEPRKRTLGFDQDGNTSD